jgi:uncharacterized protein (TIRG00374 family)
MQISEIPTAETRARKAGGLKSQALLALKLGVTLGLLAWLFRDFDLASLTSVWDRVSVGWFAAALALQFLAYAIGVLRWWLLLRRANVRVPYLSVKPAYYLGLFFNQLLPTGVGGDAVRTYRLYKRGLGARPLVGSALMDRLIGTFSLIVLAVAALFLTDAFALSRRDLGLLTGIAVLLGVLFVLLFSPRVHDWLQRPLGRHRHTPWVKAISDIIELCHSYGKAPGLLMIALVLSIVMQSIEVFIYMSLGHDLGLGLPMGSYFAVVPLALMAAGLPISLGGLGVREGVLVGLLVFMGADRQTALAVAVLFLMVVWTSVLPGLLLFLRGKH